MMSHIKIITNAEIPPKNYKWNGTKPPIQKSKYSEEEREQRRLENVRKQNAKKTKDKIKTANKNQYNKMMADDEKKTKTYEQAKAKRKLKLEKLAGRPKPENCEVCNSKGKICFDHCHNSNKFRGWLCDPCNRILGQAKDNPDVLIALSIYLKNQNG